MRRFYLPLTIHNAKDLTLIRLIHTFFFFFTTETVRVHSSVVSSISVSDPDILIRFMKAD